MRRQLMVALLAWPAACSLSACVPVAVVTLGTTAVLVAHDRRTTGTIVDDQTIELKAAKAFYDDVELRNQTHINATSYNGVVLLTGEAPSEALRQRADALVRGIPKVRTVYNEIQIGEPTSLASRADDSYITAEVKGRFVGLKDKGFDVTRVKVVTESSVVYLMGLVNKSEAEDAVSAARRVSGVRKVVTAFEYVE